MDYLKYLLLIIVPFTLIISNFIGTKKGEYPTYKKWTKGSWILFVVSFFASIGAICLSVQTDRNAELQQSASAQKRQYDSIALLRKWQYDTLSYNKLLDSSRVIINKSVTALELTNQVVNELTGGNNTPFLQISITQPIFDERSQKHYHLVYFTLLNKGKYPLQNVKVAINDWNSLAMLKYGVKQFTTGLAFGEAHVSEEDTSKFFEGKMFDLGPLTHGRNYTIYVGTLCEECGFVFGYSSDIQWNNGNLLYFVSFDTSKNPIKLKSIEIAFNGKIIKQSQDYFKFN